MTYRRRKSRGVSVRRLATRPSLIVRFGAAALVVITILGVLLGYQLKSVIAGRALDNAETSALVYIQLVKGIVLEPSVAGAVSPDGGVANQAQVSMSAQILNDPVIAQQVLSATAWTVDGRVAFSTVANTIGTRGTVPDSVVEAFLGHPVTTLAGPERVDSDTYDPAAHDGEQVMVADMPLSVIGDASPEVVIELITDYTSTAAAIRHDTAVVLGWLGAGLLALYLTLFRIVATASRKLRAQSRANQALAEHDALTGLANRTLLQEYVAAALEQARTHERGPALLLIDLDRFKEINDTLGHHTGDMLLRLVGPRLESVLGEYDHVARLGGDEFVVLLHDVGSIDEARCCAERLLAALDDPFPVEGLNLDIGASLGIAVSPVHGADFEMLLQHADVAMYEAKDSSTSIVVYDPEDDRHSPERLSLLGELRRGIDAGQLVLHFQPQADFKTGVILGAEALVRWEHPVHGLLPPDAFIPLAESTGAMRPLTLAVLDGALAFAAERMAAGEPITVAVNISARSLIDPDLTDDVESALVRHGVPGKLLVLEITESSVMSDRERARATLMRLADLGVALSIDDFGTGYSSLAYLHRLPVHELKIDRTFVSNLGAASNTAIVTASIHMAQALGLRVVAEGVEDQSTWDQLTELGCEVAQGYHLCRPVPAAEFSAWISKRRIAVP